MHEKKAENSKERKLFYFDSIGISDLYLLGKVEFLTARSPLLLHTHPGQFEICLHYEGQQFYEIDGAGYETHAGDIFFSYPGEAHSSGNRKEEKSKFFYFIFSCPRDTLHFMGLDQTASDFIVNRLYSVQTRVFKGSMIVRPILDDMMQLYFSDHPLRIPLIYSLSIKFFNELCMLIDQCQEMEWQPQDVLAAKDYIDTHPTEFPSIEMLSRLSFLSESQFKRKFRRFTTYSPHDYIIRQKIALAKEILLLTEYPVTQISHELGFSSSQLFAAVFKKYTGMTPSTYRGNGLTGSQ